MKIKNNVSYFEAGFKAAMVLFSVFTSREVRIAFYSHLTAPNVMRQFYRSYEETEGWGEDLKWIDDVPILGLLKKLEEEQKHI